MRPLILVSMILLFCFAAPAVAKKEKLREFNTITKYKGIYKAERLYQLDQRSSIWYSAKRPIYWAKVSCSLARNALRTEGTWSGNLSDTGACLGDAEASTWANGNYLNFLNSVPQNKAEEK